MCYFFYMVFLSFELFGIYITLPNISCAQSIINSNCIKIKNREVRKSVDFDYSADYRYISLKWRTCVLKMNLN